MALPTNRQEFKDYCLRRLGQGVTQINVSDEQVEDRVDEAFEFWKDYHYDACYKTYLKHQISYQEIQQGYIDVPPNIKAVIKVFNTDFGISSGIFSLRYQLHLNDLYDLSSTTLSNYVIAQQYVQTIQNVLAPESQIRFQHYSHRVIFDPDIYMKFLPNQWIILEAYIVLDEDEYPDMFKNRTLIDLCTAMIKRQWGMNMKKFEGIQLPGGITLNGQAMYSEAEREIEKLKDTFISLYQDPDDFIVA